MSTISAKYNAKLEDLGKTSSKITILETSLNDLIHSKSNISSLQKLLEIDHKIFLLEQEIKTLNDDTMNSYLLKVQPILFDQYTTNKEHSNEPIQEGELLNFFTSRRNNNKGELFNMYLSLIENKPINPKKVEFDYVCKTCNEVKIISHLESLIICPSCGEDQPYFDTGMQGLTYDQEINTDTNVHFAYKRINHFKELLAQLQAKESSNIPQDVIDQLKYEFKKERIVDPELITQQKVKTHLKKLKLNKFYENSYQITNLLTGKPPPIITPELYERLVVMFMDIQEPFEKCCPSNRKNFLSYNYVLFKFCQLLNENEIINYFPLLKSREKLYQQDCIWKDICKVMNWTYTPSV